MPDPHCNNIFTRHPHEVGETYFQHMKNANKYGIKLFFASIACLIHSLLPFLFVETASTIVRDIHDDIQNRKKELNK